MGGKGYSKQATKGGGDWEDSDRGAGNKAKRRAGGDVEAKSPTYIAHVINKGKKKVDPKKNPAVKEHHQVDANGKVIEHEDTTPSSVEEAKKKGLDGKACWKGYKLAGTKKKGGKTVDDCVKVEEQELKEYSPNVTYQAKGGKKSGKLGKSSVYSLKDKGESKKEFRKSQVKDIKGGYLKTEDFIGEVVDKTVVDTTKKIDVMKGKNKIKINPNVGEQVEKPGNSGETPNANVVDPALGRKERRISMMKRQILRKKQQAVMQGAGADIVAHNEPEGKLLTLKPDAQIIEKKDAIKKQSKKECNENETKQTLTNTIRAILENPTNVTELNRYGKETGKATGSINKRAGTPIKKGGSTDKALNYVRTKIRKETGKPEGQQSKSKGEKDRRQPGDRKGTPADTIAKRRESRADAEKLMRDTSGT